MNRAVTRSGKDGAITHLRNRSSTCSSVSKPTGIRDIDAKTHVYHVPWEFGGTGIRVVQGRNGRYLRTGTRAVSPPTLTSRLSHPVVILTAKWSQTTGEQRSGHSRSQQKG